jgi:ABC-2 type transport system ATP-binding protein
MPADPAISACALAKEYRSGLFGRRRTRALAGVTLAVSFGEIFGLLGPNGAGKTTLVKILLGIAYRTGGEAFLLGRPAPNAAARHKVGYLPESHRFPPYLTGRQALEYFGALSGLSRRERRARTEALLDRLGLADAARRKLRGYSKGMLQRLGLAQALLSDPEVVILDEPTDGVDPVGRREIRDILVDLRRRGRAVLLSSHILTEIEQVCDRVAVIDKGRLVHEGRVDDLTRRQGEWEVALARSGPEAEAAIRSAARSVEPRADGKGYLFAVESDHGVDAVIDALRARGIGIRALFPRRSTLEDRVVEMLKSGGAS